MYSKRKEKLFGLLLAVVLAFVQLVPLTNNVYAAEENSKIVTDVVVNKEYSDVYTKAALIRDLSFVPALSADGQTDHYFETTRDAGIFLRNEMENRSQTITLSVDISQVTGGTAYDRNTIANLASEYYPKLIDLAVSDDYAETGYQGDYIGYTYGGYQVSYSYNSNEIWLSYTMRYYTTYDEEQEVKSRVNKIISSLNMSNNTQYEKVKKIHDYIADHIDYWWNFSTADGYYPYTAYSGLVNGKCVCQGYAALFYLLCKEAGVEAKVVTGIGNGGKHAWNIVNVGKDTNGKRIFYNIDPTWDGQETYTRYDYFLKSDNEFPDHTRNTELSDYYKISTTSLNVSNPPTTKDSDCINCIPYKINNTNLNIKVDEQYNLNILNVGSNSIVSNYVYWSTSDPTIADVDFKGKVSALKSGSATITAQIGVYSLKCKIVVGEQITPLNANLKINGLEEISDVKVGDVVTLSTSVTGGVGKYSYKYVVHNLDNGMIYTLQDYSTYNLYNCKLTSSGNKEFYVYVRDESDKVIRTNSVKMAVKQQTSELKGMLDIDGSTLQVNTIIGSNIVLNVNASGGCGTYKYKFEVHNLDNGIVYVLQDYNSESKLSCPITSVGSKEFVAYVKDETGKEIKTNIMKVIAKDKYKDLTGKLNINNTELTVSTFIGDNIQLNATASGGSGNYTYKYVVHNLDNGIVFTLQDYSSCNTYNCNVTSEGNKEFYVYIKDGSGKEVMTNSVKVLAKKGNVLSGELNINGTKSNLTAEVGKSVQLEATASGGSGNYTYKYVVHNLDNGVICTLQDNSKNNVFNCPITSIGNKEFVVYVKDTNGTEIKTNSVRVLAKYVTKELTGNLLINGTSSLLEVLVNNTIQLTAQASGGLGDYTYKYVVHNLDNGVVCTLQDYSKNNVYNCKITSAGNKEFIVYVEDSGRNVVSTNIIKVSAR